jgi:2,3-bisphosphoglycerate-dependent phosphoglycerate mutase
MKKVTLALLSVLILAGAVSAQKKTFILVRHAEKDISATADKVDPELTADGRKRAERLVKVIKRYKPGAVYSSNFKRTRDTAAPTAAWRKKTVEIYDPKKLNELLDKMMASKTKRFLVVGHNNTTPALANLLIKEDKYKSLPESDYSKMWIIKIRKGVVKSVEVIEY